MHKEEATEDVRRWFLMAMQEIWPIAAGSLSLRKSPCIRKNCLACAKGEGHTSYALYGRLKKECFSIYVPDDLVPQIQRAIENGRRLNQLMNEAGVRYINALKRERRFRSRR